MTDVYMYFDETGTLDLDPSESPFFGVGSATFVGPHGDALWAGFELRAALEAEGIHLQQGLHAKNDSYRVREAVYAAIQRQAPRFDATLLTKAKAYPSVRHRGKAYLYQMAFWLHLKQIALQVSSPGDTIYAVVGSLQTSSKRNAIRAAIEDVCQQVAGDRAIVPCIWDAPSSWGIQVADYALWAIQRVAKDQPCPWFSIAIQPTLRSVFRPWGV